MIDQNLKPWLIEVNTNPCLETSCSLLNRIIPSVVEQVFRIAIDPIFPPPQKVQPSLKSRSQNLKRELFRTTTLIQISSS